MATKKVSQLKQHAVASLTGRRLRGESLDVIADEIEAISVAIKKLRQTRLNDDTMLLLIQNAAGQNSLTKYRKLSLKVIKTVLDSIEQLEAKHLKPKDAP